MPRVGDVYTYNNGRARFVVLHIDDDGTPWGAPLDIVHNEHGVPALAGAFDHRDVCGCTCAGLMGLPGSAVREVVAPPPDPLLQLAAMAGRVSGGMDRLAAEVERLRSERNEAVATLAGCTLEAAADLDLVSQCEAMVGAEVTAEEVAEALEGKAEDDFEPGAVTARAVAAMKAELEQTRAELERARDTIEQVEMEARGLEEQVNDLRDELSEVGA